MNKIKFRLKSNQVGQTRYRQSYAASSASQGVPRHSSWLNGLFVSCCLHIHRVSVHFASLHAGASAFTGSYWLAQGVNMPMSARSRCSGSGQPCTSPATGGFALAALATTATAVQATSLSRYSGGQQIIAVYCCPCTEHLYTHAVWYHLHHLTWCLQLPKLMQRVKQKPPEEDLAGSFFCETALHVCAPNGNN